MTATRSIALLAAAAFVMQAADVRAQGAFPAPLPGQSAAPAPANNASPFPPVSGAPAASPFPPVNGAASAAPVRPAPSPSAFTGGAAPIGGTGFGPPQSGPPPGAEECQKGFLPLRADTEAKGKLVQAAGKRKASPQEACKLIGNFVQANAKMLKFVEANSQKCGIPAQVGEQMKKGQASYVQLQQRVCSAASQQQAGPAGPSLSEALGSASLPEAKPLKRGGSTFDTLNGNVLTR